jgi:EAL domain-containing protein (putative c-di-GMP-specific phosphodiesterase class I)
MVTLAHALKIEVTAEGVETHEQMTILKAMGCNLFQGFLLSPPGTEDVVETKFRRAMERRRTPLANVA